MPSDSPTANPPGHRTDIHGDVNVAGDFVGRDQITIHDVRDAKGLAIGAGARAIVTEITNNIHQALSAVDEADKARGHALRILGENVRSYAHRLSELAGQGSDAQQGGPYRGLIAYTLADAELFYGRSRAIRQLLEHIAAHRLTVLQAESGAGKSSLLQAGIAPQLILNGHLPVILRPYDLSPGMKIKQTFLAGLERYSEFQDAPLRSFLHQVTGFLDPSTILYLVLDQFEEFFTLRKSGGQTPEEQVRSAFVHELADCLEDPSLNVRWVLSLRSEFFGDLAHFRPRIRNPFDNDYRLNRLDRSEAEEVITAPAAQVGLAFEPLLVEAILADLQQPDGQIAPPQIQLVCQALYQAFQDAQASDPSLPNTLTLAIYEQEGRARGILGRHLQRVLSRTFRTQAEQDLARRLLVELVSANQRRLRLSHSELARRLATALPAGQSLDAVLAGLVDARLLIARKDDEDAAATYELAHDYLLGEIQIDPAVQAQKAAQELLQQEVEAYQRFKTLLSKDKFAIIDSQRALLVLDERAKALLRLSEAAIRQEEHEKEAARQRELEQAQALAAEQERVAEAERKRAEAQAKSVRQLRHRAWLIAGVATLALMAAIVAGLSFRTAQSEANARATEVVQRRTAEAIALTREAEAKREAVVAQANQLMTLGSVLFEATPLAGLRLAIEGLATIPRDHASLAQIELSARQMVQQGRLLKLGQDDLQRFYPSPSGNLLILDRNDEHDELLPLDGAAPIPIGAGPIGSVEYDPNEAYALITYFSASEIEPRWVRELRRIDNGDLLLQADTAAFDDNPIHEIGHSPDWEYFVISSYENTRILRLVDMSTVITFSHGIYGDLTFYEDQVRVRFYDFDKDSDVVELYNLANGERTALPPTVGREFSPDGRYLVAAPASSTEALYDLNTGRFIPLTQDPGWVTAIQFITQTAYFVVSYQGGHHELRHVETAQPIVLSTELGAVQEIEFSPLRKYFVVTYLNNNGNGEQKLELRETTSGNIVSLASFPADDEGNVFDQILFSPQESYLQVAYPSGEMKVLDIDRHEVVYQPVETFVVFSPDDSHLVDTNDDGYRWVTHIAAPGKPQLGGTLRHVEFSPKGKFFHTIDENYQSKLVRSANDEILLQGGDIDTVMYSPDETYFVVSYEIGASQLWDGGQGRMLAELDRGISQLQFDAARGWLLISYEDGEGHLLDLAWLSAVADMRDPLDIDGLIQFACTRLAGRAIDTSTIKRYLGDVNLQACA